MILRVAAAMALCALSCGAHGQPAQSGSQAQSVVEQASALLEKAEGNADPSRVESARCLGVVLPPQGTGTGHLGLVSCRNGDTWSPPAMIAARATRSSTPSQPLIFGITNGPEVEELLHGDFELLARPIGHLPGFSGLSGLGGGVRNRPNAFPPEADGLVISNDSAGNHLLYGEGADLSKVLSGGVSAPPQEAAFSRKLEQYVLLSEYGRTGGGGGGASTGAPAPAAPATMGQGAAPSPPSPPPPPPASAPEPTHSSTPSEARPASAASTSSSANGRSSPGGSKISTGGFGTPVAVTRRVTGIAFVPPTVQTPGGYGLYSYVLIDHRPAEEERARLQAFFIAMLGRPTAASLAAAGVPLNRINITALLVTTAPDEARLNRQTAEKQADWVIDHYDYGRSAAILACLPGNTGPGPVIVSLLQPVDVSRTPHPVLIQDLSHAQAPMMNSYVAEFVLQASRDQFWNERALEQLTLQLRNLMEVAAVGLGMSQEAVESWLKMVK